MQISSVALGQSCDPHIAGLGVYSRAFLVVIQHIDISGVVCMPPHGGKTP